MQHRVRAEDSADMAEVSKRCRASEKQTWDLSVRSLVLFISGVVISLAMTLLQREHVIATLPVHSTLWVAACCGVCGAVAVAVGLAYPCVDGCVGQQAGKSDWSNVMRCVVVFFGITEASVKIPFEDSRELALSLAAMSLGFWWMFDGTGSGFGLGLSVALFSTSFVQQFISYSEPDLLFVRWWLACLFFSGGITVGQLGRQLAWDVKKMA